MCYKKRWFWVGVIFLIGVLILTGWTELVHAQAKYPTRAIDIICPMAPGGGTDVTDRLIAAYLNKKFRVPANVINKPGGNSVPACLEVYQAAPDGYTLLGDGTVSSYMLAVAVKNIPFKVMDRTFLVITSFLLSI